jgi:hypothetical protein
LEGSGFLNSGGDFQQGAVKRLFVVDCRGDLRQACECSGALAKLLRGLRLFLESTRVSQCDGGLQGERLDGFEGGRVKEGWARSM